MTTVLSLEGQIVLRAALQYQLHLEEPRFEVFVDEEDTVPLRRNSNPANRRLVDLLLACPAPFEVPPSDKDDSRPLPL